MPKPENLYQTLPDGTLKHSNPLTGTLVWTVPSRAHRPFRRPATPVHPLAAVDPENYCDFCAASYLKTPPEKSRLIRTAEGTLQKIDRLAPDLYNGSRALFRRVANLFEIVTLDYWRRNLGFQPSAFQREARRAYLENPRGRAHVLDVIGTKLAFSGYSPQELERLGEENKLSMADAFFFGSHDLIIAGRHYAQGARTDDQYYSSGEMSPEDHRTFLRFTLDAMTDLYAQNPLIRYVAVFQNWLHPAGASLNHLHKQVVGMDEWGVSMEREVAAVRADPGLYNEGIVGPARDRGLWVAENEHALAICEWGHRYPTLAVYSKSGALPQDHTPEELAAVSDLVHACHAATGDQVPCNEEWYYPPRDAGVALPWHILIKWRTINQAGFEGATHLYVNPLAPRAMREQVTARLFELRGSGKIAPMRIADECGPEKAPLRYGRRP